MPLFCIAKPYLALVLPMIYRCCAGFTTEISGVRWSGPIQLGKKLGGVDYLVWNEFALSIINQEKNKYIMKWYESAQGAIYEPVAVALSLKRLCYTEEAPRLSLIWTNAVKINQLRKSVFIINYFFWIRQWRLLILVIVFGRFVIRSLNKLSLC